MWLKWDLSWGKAWTRKCWELLGLGLELEGELVVHRGAARAERLAVLPFDLGA